MSDYPIPAYEPMSDAVLTDAERWPAQTSAGARRLEWLRTHPRAPLYNHACGDRLTAGAVERLRGYDFGYRGWTASNRPEWTDELVARTGERVPRYRGVRSFDDVAPVGRGELLSRVERAVPDDADLSELIVHTTSGSRGPAATVPMTPEFCALDLPLFEHVLAGRGISVASDGVALVTVYAMPVTYQFASVSSYWDGAGVVKVNLHPSAWRSPEDRVAFLDDCAPQLYSGNPLSLSALAELGLSSRPKAVFSGAMALDSPGALADRLGAPVFDVYGTTETGLLAYRTEGAHTVLPRRVYIEVLDEDGRLCAEGERGEIVVTSGENPLLPLLRYRTGDHAALEWRSGVPVLVGLAGREPVRFRVGGEWVESIEVTQLLTPLALPAYEVHQARDGAITVTVPIGTSEPLVASAARPLLGEVAVRTTDLRTATKPQRYSTQMIR